VRPSGRRVEKGVGGMPYSQPNSGHEQWEQNVTYIQYI